MAATPTSRKAAPTAKAPNGAAAVRPALIPVAEQEKLSLIDLARAVVEGRARPGVKQQRLLAQATLDAQLPSPVADPAPEPEPVVEALKPEKAAKPKAKKAKSGKGKKGKKSKKLAKIPKKG